MAILTKVYDPETELAIKAAITAMEEEGLDDFDVIDRILDAEEPTVVPDEKALGKYLMGMRTEPVNMAPRQRGRFVARLIEKGIIQPTM